MAKDRFGHGSDGRGGSRGSFGQGNARYGGYQGPGTQRLMDLLHGTHAERYGAGLSRASGDSDFSRKGGNLYLGPTPPPAHVSTREQFASALKGIRS